MTFLVVVAHPMENSLCQFLADETIKHLNAEGHNVVVKNLYREAFDPRLSLQERQSYYQPHFDVTWLQRDIDQLRQAESLLLVFPTWWFGFPAILKGWFDRVWAPGHAYNHAADLGAITPGLDKLKQVYVITTLGSPWWVDTFILWKPVYRVLKIAILGACTRSCTLKIFSLYKSENISSQRVAKFIAKIRAAV